MSKYSKELKELQSKVQSEVLEILNMGPISSRQLTDTLAGNNGVLRWEVFGAIDDLINPRNQPISLEPLIKKAQRRGHKNGEQVIYYLTSQEQTLVENGVLSREERAPTTILNIGTEEQIRKLFPAYRQE